MFQDKSQPSRFGLFWVVVGAVNLKGHWSHIIHWSTCPFCDLFGSLSLLNYLLDNLIDWKDGLERKHLQETRMSPVASSSKVYRDLDDPWICTSIVALNLLTMKSLWFIVLVCFMRHKVKVSTAVHASFVVALSFKIYCMTVFPEASPQSDSSF